MVIHKCSQFTPTTMPNNREKEIKPLNTFQYEMVVDATPRHVSFLLNSVSTIPHLHKIKTHLPYFLKMELLSRSFFLKCM